MNDFIGAVWQAVRWPVWSVTAAGGAFLAYHAGKRVYDDVHERRTQARRDRIELDDLEQARQLASIRTIQADARGRYPLLYGTSGVIRDPASLRSFTLDAVLERWPYLDRVQVELEALRQLVTMNVPNSYHNEHIVGDQLGAGEQEGDQVEPEIVTLGKHSSTLDALLTKYSFRPSLHNILIGEYVDQEANEIKPLTLSIPHSVHILCTGASGLGKSTLLEAIALQLAGLAGVQLAAVDYGSGTFDALEGALRWPLADSPSLAIALFRQLIQLFEKRRELYKRADRVRSLDQYNATTGDNLPFVVCFVDETSALLEHDGTKEPLVEIARVGRKYGLGLVLGGTDFAADTLPSKARGNCQARVAFWLEKGLSQSLLNSHRATRELTGPGEIMVRKPGTVGLFKGRAPLVTTASYALLPHPSVPRGELLTADVDGDQEQEPSPRGNGNGHKPNLDDLDDPTLPDDERARQLVAAGVSKRQTAIRVFGGAAGSNWRKLERALAGSSSTEVETGAAQPLGEVTRGGLATTTTAARVDFCDFCGDFAGDVDDGRTFATCSKCGVAVCSHCAIGGLCPDCQEGEN